MKGRKPSQLNRIKNSFEKQHSQTGITQTQLDRDSVPQVKNIVFMTPN